MNNVGNKRMKVHHHFLHNNQQQQQLPSAAEDYNNNTTTASLSPMSTGESNNTHNNHYTLVQDSSSSLFARANNAVRLSQLETDNQMIQTELANLNMRLDTLEARFVQANERIWITLQQILQRLNSPDNNKVVKNLNTNDCNSTDDKKDV
jgi:hypothetical protein